MTLFTRVLEPLKIGAIEIKNRFIMAPMVVNYAGTDGELTERYIAYLLARAKGKIGMIITEAAYVHQSGKGFVNQIGIHKDELVESHNQLTQAVHQHNCKIVLQLYHAGRQTVSEVTGMPILAPSPVPCLYKKEMPREMNKAEIKEIVQAFGKAAVRAKRAGYDAVEIHGAHGYLINQFLSSYSNKRTDEYGGSLDNRCRFALEVIEEVRKTAGEDFPVIFRISSDEFVSGGIVVGEAKIIAKKVVDAGVDAIHVSGGNYQRSDMIVQPATVQQGCYADNAAVIKEEIRGRVPVLVVGRIKDPKLAEEIIDAGKADAVVMGRALLADANLVKKIYEGMYHRIRKCTGCCQGCIDRLSNGFDVQCLTNAETGNEYRLDLSMKAEIKKRVLVVGAGPAGLEAARVAALSGHEVFLFESKEKLGGLATAASIPPYKEELNELIDYFINEIKELGVTVKVRSQVNKQTIIDMNPDAVILATGSVPFIPYITGIEGKNVVTAENMLNGSAGVGRNVVVIGGGMVGCETAELIKSRNNRDARVTIVEMLPRVAGDMPVIPREMLFNRMKKLGIEVVVKSRVVGIKDGGIIEIEKNGEVESMDGIDTVVLASGYRSNNLLAQDLKKDNITFLAAGDCIKPRKILDAIHEGFYVARNI